MLIIPFVLSIIFTACTNSTEANKTYESNKTTTVVTTVETTCVTETSEEDSTSEATQRRTIFSELYEGELAGLVDFTIPEGFSIGANGDKLEKYNLMTDIRNTVFFQNGDTDIIIKFDESLVIEETEESYNSTVEQVVATMKYVYPDIVINCWDYTNEKDKLISIIVGDSEDIKYGFLVCEIADSLLTISINSSELNSDEIHEIITGIGDSIKER